MEKHIQDLIDSIIKKRHGLNKRKPIMKNKDIKYYKDRIKILEKAKDRLHNAIDVINRNIDDCNYKIYELESYEL